MLEELFKLIKANAQETVVNNAEIPNEHNDEVIAEATSTVASGFRNIVAGGGLQNLLSLFKQQGAGNQSSSGFLNNPIVNMMVGHFAGKLMSKFNFGSSQASNVSNSLIPGVISSLVNKTNDPSNNGFSLEGLLNSITGGQLNNINTEHSGTGGFDLSQLTDQLSNGGQTGLGGGLMDIVAQLAGGAQAQQQKNGGGGLMDLIQGYLKK